MDIKMEFFSYDSLSLLQKAHKIASDLSFDSLGTDHLLLAFCEKNNFLMHLGIDFIDLKYEMLHLIGFGSSSNPPTSYTLKAKEIIENSLDEVSSFKNSSVEPIHIFISLLKQKDCMSLIVFENLNIDVDSLIKSCYELISVKI